MSESDMSLGRSGSPIHRSGSELRVGMLVSGLELGVPRLTAINRRKQTNDAFQENKTSCRADVTGRKQKVVESSP
jgi:hypothetical protein